MNKSLFDTSLLKRGLEIAPRVLSHQDRNILSPSYGYFGRRYWAWKSAAMPDASNMYAIYYLALLWYLDTKQNRFYKKEYILDAISSGIVRWVKLQNKDGSFDQMFPNEHSVGATLYTLLAILKTKDILGDHITAKVSRLMISGIEKSAKFSLQNDETYGIISNHLALFAYTFHCLYKFSGDAVYKKKAKTQIGRLMDNMSAEGWFREYQGADPGYQTQCTYYLAMLLEEGYEEIRKPLRKSIVDFLPYFIHPDGSCGGYYGSRNTSIVYPAGFAILGKQYPQAKRLLAYICQGIEKETTPVPLFLDFPNAFRLGVNYLLAWQLLQKNSMHNRQKTNENEYRLPFESDEIDKMFMDAGIYVKGTSKYYAMIGFKKGGVIKIFNKKSKENLFDHSGYIVQVGHQWASSQAVSCPEIQFSPNRFEAKHPFFMVRLNKMTPFKYMILSVLGLTAFRVKPVRELFKKLLVSLLITGKVNQSGFYRRQIFFGPDQVDLIDTFNFDNSKSCRHLKGLINHATCHMASADYFDFSHAKKQKPLYIERLPKSDLKIKYNLTIFTSAELNIEINSNEAQ